MNATYPEFLKHWESTAPTINKHIALKKDLITHKYLNDCVAVFTFVLENWDSKITKNKELSGKLSIFLVQMYDLIRAVFVCYEQQTLTPLNLLLRTSFESRVNYLYIVNSQEPAKLADLFHRFKKIDEYYGLKNFDLIEGTQRELKELSSICPEWFDINLETGFCKLKFEKKPLHWTATAKNIRDLAAATHVNLEDYYAKIFKSASKFSHPSAVVNNLYRENGNLMPIASERDCGRSALLTAYQCLSILENACKFFGVPFPNEDWAHNSHPAEHVNKYNPSI